MSEAERAARAAAAGASEFAKRLASEPATALVQVQQHVRAKGLEDQVAARDALLTALTALREGAAGAGGAGPSPAAAREAAARVERLTARVGVLQERLEIVSRIHRDVRRGPGSARAESAARIRRALRTATGRAEEPPSPDTLPLGVGQGLDNELMSGEVDVDVDEYALQISRLARTFAELEGASKRKEDRAR